MSVVHRVIGLLAVGTGLAALTEITDPGSGRTPRIGMSPTKVRIGNTAKFRSIILHSIEYKQNGTKIPSITSQTLIAGVVVPPQQHLDIYKNNNPRNIDNYMEVELTYSYKPFFFQSIPKKYTIKQDFL